MERRSNIVRGRIHTCFKLFSLCVLYGAEGVPRPRVIGVPACKAACTAAAGFHVLSRMNTLLLRVKHASKLIKPTRRAHAIVGPRRRKRRCGRTHARRWRRIRDGIPVRQSGTRGHQRHGSALSVPVPELDRSEHAGGRGGAVVELFRGSVAGFAVR